MKQVKKIFSTTGEPMLSARAAALKLGCSQDYISKLCREGKLQGTQVKGAWFVDESSLKSFEASRVEAKATRSQELSSLRRQEQEAHEAATQGIVQRTLRKVGRKIPSSIATRQGAQALVLSGLLGALVFGGSALITSGYQGATLGAALGQLESPFFGTGAQLSLQDVGASVKNLLSAWFSSAQTPIAQTQTPVVVQQQPSTPVATPTNSAPTPTTIVQNTYPIRDHIIERVVTQSGVTQETLTSSLEALGNSLRSELYSALNTPSGNLPSSGGVVNNVALSQNIDKLRDVTITNATLDGVSGLTASEIPALDYFPSTTTVSIAYGGTGTSSAPNYGQLLLGNAGGGYDLVSTSSLGIGLSASAGGSAGQVQYNGGGPLVGNAGFTFDSNAAELSVTNSSSTNATSTNATSTNLFATSATVGSLVITGITGSTQCLHVDSSGTVSGSGADCGTGSGGGASFPFTPTSNFGAPVVSTSTPVWFTAGLQASSTSHLTNLDFFNATGTTLALTGSSTVSGVFNALGTVNLGTVSANSLTLASALTVANGGTGISSPTAAGVLLGNYAGTGYQQLATSSLGLLTTNVAEGSNLYYSDARVNSFVAASTTVPKTYIANTFTALNTFANILTTGSTTLQNFTGINATSSNATSTNFFATTASSTNLFTSNLSIANLSGLLKASNGAVATAIADTDYTTPSGLVTAVAAGYPFQGAGNSTSTLTQFNGGLTATTILATGSTTLQNFTGVNATTSQATTTNFAISGISGQLLKTLSNGAVVAATPGTDYQAAGNYATFGYLFPGNATSTNITFNGGLTASNILATGSTTLQNFTALNSTSSSATSTNFFAATANSTNLFATNATVNNFSGAGLTTCNSSTQKLLWASGTFSCGTDLNTGGGGGTDVNWTFFNGSGIQVGTTSNQVLIGAASTSTLSQLEVHGGATIDLSTTTSATTTNLAITGISSSLLKTLSNGAVVAATPGTDYQAAGNYATFGYLFPGNATSTNITFSAGLTGNLTGNADTVTNGVYTTTFGPLFDNRLSASSSISGITTLPNLSLPYSQLNGTPSIPGYPFPLAGNATSTLTQFNGGLTAYASSTISDGLSSLSVSNSGGVDLNYNGHEFFLGNNSFLNFAGTVVASTLPYASSTALTADSLFATNLLATGSTTLQNFTARNSTSTNATSTNSFATTASSTNLFAQAANVGSFAIGNLSGFLKATGGAVSTALVNLTSDVSGILPIANGGTNANSQTSSGVTYFDGSKITSGSALTFDGTTLATNQLLATGSSTLQNFTAALATTSQATTTNFAISSISSKLLKTLSDGAVVAATAGTDYLTSADVSPFPFTTTANYGVTVNSTSTPIWFTNGLQASSTSQIAYASTTALSAITGYFGVATTTALNVSGTATFQSLASSLLSTNSSGATQLTTISNPLQFSGSTLSISQAGTGSNGYLTSSDYNLFNNKISSSSLSGTGPITYSPSTGAIGLDTTVANSYTGLQSFLHASSTLFSVSGTAYFGGTATTTIDSAGNINVAGNFTGAGLSTCGGSTDKLIWTGGQFACGTDAGSSGTNEINWSFFNGSGVRLGTTSNQVIIGATATSSGLVPLAAFNVIGGAGIDNATTTNLFSTTASSTNLRTSQLGIASTSLGANTRLAVGGGNIVQSAQSPVSVFATTTAGQVYQTVVSGRYAYMAEYSAGLRIIDISDPRNPTFVGSYTGLSTVISVAVSGNYAYVGNTDGLYILDISNPHAPTLVAKATGITGFPYGVAVSGKYAYVADYSGGALRVVDISDPRNPAVVGSYNTGGGTPTGVVVSGKYAYVADQGLGRVTIVDISNPTAPALVSFDSEIGSPTGLFVSGRYLYTTDSGQGLYILDISNPASTTLIAKYKPSSPSVYYGVVAAGNYAYVADRAGTSLLVLNVKDPRAPFLVGTSTTAVSADALTLAGNYAYTSGGSDGLNIAQINGAELPSANIGALDAGSLNLGTDLSVGGNVTTEGGLNVGISGILSRGAIAAYVASSTAINPVVASFIGGNVGIGTTTPYSMLSVAGQVVGQNFVATSTTAVSSFQQLLANASTTLQNFTALNSTSTNATTTNLYASGTVTAANFVDTSFSGNNCIGESSGVMGQATNCVSSVASAGGSLTVSSPTGNVDVSINGAHTNTFTALQNFANASTSLFSVTNKAYFGSTATTTIDSTGNISGAGTISANGTTGYFAIDGNRTLYASSTTHSVQVGFGAGNTTNVNAAYNAILGYNAGNLLTSGANNVLIGGYSTSANSNLSSGSNNISIGYNISLPSATNNNQLDIGNLIYGTAVDGNGSTLSTGKVGIGTTTPWGKLSVDTTSLAAGVAEFAVGSSTRSDLFINQGGQITVGGTASSTIGQLSVMAGANTITRVSQSNLANDGGFGGNSGGDGIYTQGRYAYIVEGGGNANAFEIFDVSNPASPTRLSQTSFPYPLDDNDGDAVSVQGKYAYIITGGSNSDPTFFVYDVSNPSQPRLMGSAVTGAFDWADIYVSGRYAYLAIGGNGPHGFEIFDVSNPSTPTQVSDTTLANGAGAGGTDGIYVQNGYAYIAEAESTTNAFEIYNVSNPASPIRVSQSNLANSSSVGSGGDDISVQGRYAYITEGGGATNAFEIFDVSNPASPSRVSQSNLANGSSSNGESNSISVQGRYAYIAEGSGTTNAFETFDVSNPAIPTRVAQNNLSNANGSTGGGNAISVQGRYAYIAEGGGTTNAFEIFDLGGEYAQQLEAGGIETGTLSVRNNLSALDGSFAGGLTAGGSLSITGSGSFVAATSTFNTTANIFNITTASSTNSILSVLGNGNVGIGTTTPGSLLSVGNTNGINFSTATSTFSSTGGINITSGCYAVSGTCLSTSGSSLTGTTGQVAYFSGTNTAVGTSSLFISAAGNVGIGTTNPGSPLSVSTPAQQSGALPLFTVASTTNSSLFTVNGDGTTAIGAAFSGALVNIEQNIAGTPSGTNSNIRAVRLKPTLTAAAGNSYTALQINPLLTGSFTQTNTTGATIAAPALAGGAAMTNLAGLDIAEQTGATNNTDLLIGQTTLPIGNFGIYNSSTQNNYFAGNIGVGSTTPFATLAINPVAGGASNQFVVGSSTATAFIINNSGNVGIGTTNPTLAFNTSGSQAKLQVADVGAGASLSVSRFSNDTSAPRLVLQKSRGTSVGSFAALQSGDTVGTLLFAGSGNSLDASSSAANISSVLDGTPSGGNTLPGALTFNINGATEAMRITSASLVGIGTTTPWAKLSVDTTSLAAGVPEFAVGSSTRSDLVINQSGNVGIGTSTTAAVFNVQQSAANPALLKLFDSTGVTRFNVGPGFNITAADQYGVNNLQLADASTTITYLAGTGGNVGIGSTTPFATLAVNPIAGATNQFVVGSSTATSFIINNSGNVGIGTTSPSALFAVTGAGNVLPIIQSTDNNAVQLILQTDNTNRRIAGVNAAKVAQSQIVLDNNIINLAGNTTSSLISVGVGSSTPWAKLSVNTSNLNANQPEFAVGSSTRSDLFINQGGQITVGGTASSTIGQLSVMAGANTITRVSQSNLAQGANAGGGDSVAIQGRYVYLAEGSGTTNAFEIFDVSNPATPVRMSQSNLANGANGVSSDGVAVSGHYAYIVEGGGTANAFEIFDVSNPAVPLRVSQTTLVNNAGDAIYVQGRYAYIMVGGSNTNSFNVFDISNPAKPVLVGQANSLAFDGESLYVQGNYAYAAIGGLGSNGLEIFNISNPSAPALVGTGNLASGATTADSIYVQGRYAYIAEGGSDGGGSGANLFEIFDVSNPVSPTRVSQSSLANGAVSSDPNGGPAIYVQGRYAYIAEGAGTTNAFEVFDISTPAAPIRVAQNNLANGSPTSGQPDSIVVQGRYAYIAEGKGTTNSFEIFDLGGEYAQQLEAGGIETGTLSVRNNLSALDGSFAGGLTAGGSLSITGSGSFVAATSTFNTTANIFNITTASSTNSILSVLGNGNVGIGTTTPWGKLSVDTSNLAAGVPEFAVGSSTRTDLTITQAGNVGIGTTTPFRSLDVSTSLAIAAVFNGAAGTGNSAAIGLGGSAGAGFLQAYTNDTFGATANLNIQANGGMLGIASSTPWGLLSVNPTAANTGTGPQFVVGSSTATAFIINNSGNVGIGSTTPWGKLSVDTSNLAAGVPEFAVGSSTRSDLTITQAGNVGIGTTSPFAVLSVSTPAQQAPTSQLFAIASTTGSSLFSVEGNGKVQIGPVSTGSVGALLNIEQNISGNDAGSIRALRFLPTLTAAASSDYAGFLVQLGLNGSFTQSSSQGIEIKVPVLTTATMTSLVGMSIAEQTGATNNIDLLLGTNTIPAAGNFGIYNSSTQNNYFAGKVGIATTTPGATLTVAGAGCFAKTSAGIGCSTATVAGDIYYGSAHAAGGFDAAEQYLVADTALAAPGTILGLDYVGTSTLNVATTSTNVIGIVSSNPGLTFGNYADTSSSTAPLALSGRVPVRVSLENGPIQTGDRITLSSIPGVGMKAGSLDQSVGVALEPYTHTSASSTIMVFVNLQKGTDTQAIGDALLGSSTTATSTPGVVTSFVSSLFARITSWLGSATNGIADLFATHIHAQIVDAQTVNTQTLCIGATCVTETQLKALLNGQAAAVVTAPSTDSTSTTSAPILSVNGNNPASIAVGSTYSDLGATIVGPSNDLNLGILAAVDGGTPRTTDQLYIDTSAPGTHTIIYSATDQNGVVGSAQRTVVVFDPNAATSTPDNGDSGQATSTQP